MLFDVSWATEIKLKYSKVESQGSTEWKEVPGKVEEEEIVTLVMIQRESQRMKYTFGQESMLLKWVMRRWLKDEEEEGYRIAVLHADVYMSEN